MCYLARLRLLRGFPSSALTLAAVGRGRRRSACGSRAAWKRWRWLPGSPTIAAQEKRDRVPGGTYQRLVSSGALVPADGQRVPSVGLLVDAIMERWGGSACIVCDRFRLPELEDAAPGWAIEPRVAQWSASTEDIRRLAASGERRNASRC